MNPSTRGIDGRYSRIQPVCKLLSPIFKYSSYVCAVVAALLAVISAVLLFVNVKAEELIFTPYMDVVEKNGVKYFDIELGNGVRVLREYSEVAAGDIKGTLYAGIFTLIATLAVCVPVLYLLSRLLKNVGQGRLLAYENAAYVNYIGVCIMFGNPLVLLVKRYFNYKMMSYFVDIETKFDFGIDMFGVVLGLLIVALGTVYGYACTQHIEEMALVITEAKNERI